MLLSTVTRPSSVHCWIRRCETKMRGKGALPSEEEWDGWSVYPGKPRLDYASSSLRRCARLRPWRRLPHRLRLFISPPSPTSPPSPKTAAFTKSSTVSWSTSWRRAPITGQARSRMGMLVARSFDRKPNGPSRPGAGGSRRRSRSSCRGIRRCAPIWPAGDAIAPRNGRVGIR